MSRRPSPSRRPRLRALLLAVVVAIALGTGSTARGEEPPRGARVVERYPPTFRLKIAEAIERGKHRLLELQAKEGHWGNPEDVHAMGHTALPLLALLKGGMAPEAEPIQRGFAAIRGKPMTSTYAVGCAMMAIHARYDPRAGTLDTDVDKPRDERPDPKALYRRLSSEDKEALEAGLDYFLSAQAVHGLWHYHVQEGPRPTGHDLSCTQYAVLGLRAIEACGLKVPVATWRNALQGLFRLQTVDGPSTELLDWRLKDGYAFEKKEKARQRGFHYRMGKKHGPLGENTLWQYPETGSMTTAGIASLLICRESLWRRRKFSGTLKRQTSESLRDALAWLQEQYAIEENPGRGKTRLHYYLYGLERAAMLAGRRWIGTHDWYEEGATFLLESEHEKNAWGNHVPTSFVILFLKRATTRGQDVPVVTR